MNKNIVVVAVESKVNTTKRIIESTFKVLEHSDVDTCIIGYFASSDKITDEEAKQIFDSCTAIGFRKGTNAFDRAISQVCCDLNLCTEELKELIQSY